MEGLQCFPLGRGGQHEIAGGVQLLQQHVLLLRFGGDEYSHRRGGGEELGKHK